MKPKRFKGQNIVFGQGQKEYAPLPAMRVPGPEGIIVSCWEPSEDEIRDIVRNKRIYLSQVTFNGKLQPVNMSTSLSFVKKSDLEPKE